MIKWRKLAIRIHHCPVCESTRPIVRLDDNELSVRCLICRSTPITMSIVTVLSRISPCLKTKIVYELSSRGSLFKYLYRKTKKLIYSEYFDEWSPGTFVNGVQCQDVQRLTYNSDSFDICTSTEVFEHVPNDLKGFSEIRRVLKKGGFFLFTVPLGEKYDTVERATIDSTGEIIHWLEPQYHRDPLRAHKSILSFRDYGEDIVERLRSQGFSSAQIVTPEDFFPWGFKRKVVVAYR